MTINENIGFTDYASGIRLPDCSKLAVNWKIDNDVTIFQHDMIFKLFWCCFVSPLVKLVTGLSFMSLSSLVLELWQFIFIRDWLEIRKLEIPPSKFCPIPGDWGKLAITNLAQSSPIKCYQVLQNARVTVLTVTNWGR